MRHLEPVEHGPGTVGDVPLRSPRLAPPEDDASERRSFGPVPGGDEVLEHGHARELARHLECARDAATGALERRQPSDLVALERDRALREPDLTAQRAEE